MKGVFGERRAGVAVPLFSLRGERDVGIGEFLDLVPFFDWAAEAGLSIVVLLPLGETAPGELSPYNALSSFALDPLHISPHALPELSGVSIVHPSLASATVDREAARRFKAPLLAEAFARFQALPGRDPRVCRFVGFHRRHRGWLREYALFGALAEEHGFAPWREWPEPLRRRDPAALRRTRDALAPRVGLLEYLQFAAAEQWQEVRAQAARRGILLLGDLPFAPSENSADVWAHPESFDVSRSAGAPPDAFSSTGQRWGLPMPRWEDQRRSGWKWMRARARRLGDLYDLVRVDHVVGLFRTYFFVGEEPMGFDPAEEEAQIRQGGEILRVLLRAGVRIVAEDLGAIPPFVPKTLAALDVPGYRVLRWERHDEGFTDPRTYPECSITTTGTHDTETLVAWWRELAPEDRGSLALFCTAGLDGSEAELSAAGRHAILELLLGAPSRYTVFPLQDLLGWPERINVPGVIDAMNWTWRLPGTMDDLARSPAFREETSRLRVLIDASGRNRTMSLMRRP